MGMTLSGFVVKQWQEPLNWDFLSGFHLVTGISGSGKSTFLLGLAGQSDQVSGVICMEQDRYDYQDAADRQRFFLNHVSMLCHNPHLIQELSVRENLALPEKITQRRGGYLSSLQELCHVLQIEDLMDRLASDLSQGEAHRIAMARALYFARSLLILDEPFVHIQPELKKPIMQYLAQRMLNQSLVVLISTHDPEVSRFFGYRSQICFDSSRLKAEVIV
ncbi:MAG: ATP-binding cassette domain-containing protein [Candidatus Cloacimonetes bacterium]|nr:ATP-binding cassette domain-containing protein [Candidatus Cloacimonadota bacterium]